MDVVGMRTEQPLAALRRRLAGEAESGSGAQGGEVDSDDAAIPSWVPDGAALRRRDWVAAVRADPGRSGAIALAVITALAVLITLFTVVRNRPAPVVSAKLPPVDLVSSAAPRPSGGAAPSNEPARSVVVSVVGLVTQPGLVTLAPDARIADAVAAAGGALKGADTLGLNMARHVADGEQIVVGIAAPAGHRPALGSSAGPASANPGAPAGTGAPAAPVDLNTATADQLDALPGVGPVTAAAIIAWRTAHGRFGSVDQLGEVDGIGPARLEKLRALVRV